MGQPRILVVDLGGKTIKLALRADGRGARTPSGPTLGPAEFLAVVREAVADWGPDLVSIGCPAPVEDGAMALEPHNLGPGWRGVRLDLETGRPTRVVNDAAMQAIGSYDRGKMLFLGLGTGLGAALVVEDLVLSLEVAHLPYRDGLTFEDCVGARGLEAHGREVWRAEVDDVVARLKAAMVADEVVLGGGNAVLVDPLPPATRRGGNDLAIVGGERLWERSIRVR
jgi:polyphosphate glucokinase